MAPSAPDTPTLIEEEVQLRAPDGTGLWVRSVRGQGVAPRGRLGFVHGFAEHGGRYRETLRWFAERGFAAAALDLRGHGRSDGTRTYVTRFGEYLDDVQTYVKWLGAQTPGAPLFLVGHSMGGLVVARTLQVRPELQTGLAGAVLCSPLFAVKMPLPAWKTLAGRLLSRLVPRFALPADVDVTHLSKLEAEQQAYAADPLVTKTATARWFTECTAAQAAAADAAGRLALPLLVLHGEDDRLVCPQTTARTFDRLGAPDRTLALFPGARHELWNEAERDEVRGRVLAWLEARTPGGGC